MRIELKAFTRGVGTTSLLSRLNSLKTASSPPFS
jgi:hypothetical protein